MSPGLAHFGTADVANECAPPSPWKPGCVSGVLVCSSSLLIRGPILPAVRQKLHLSPCADFRSRLSR